VKRATTLPAAIALAACAAAPAVHGSVDAAARQVADAGPAQCLGNMYEEAPVIDPDHPVFSDASHTAEQVAAMFAQAAAENSRAYQAYRAARDQSAVLSCAFCACGCSSSPGHLSAIDCFKDLHGFG